MVRIFKVSSVFLLVAATLASETSDPEPVKFQLKEEVQVVLKQDRDPLSHFPKVNGVRECGGQGKFVEWRSESCDESTPDSLCEVPGGKVTTGGISFIPKESADALGYRFIVTDSTTKKILQKVLQPRLEYSVEGGNEYTLFGSCINDVSLRGKPLTFQIRIFRASDKVEEICAEADYKVV